jgi:thiosulfate/3-mercaptopyruvate sulfurtransferase
MMTVLLRYLLLALPLATAPAWGAAGEWSVLLSPQALARLLAAGEGAPQILRVSGDYASGHIPGAIPANYADFRGPSDNPGALPPLAALTATVQSLGIEGTRPVVLVHEGSGPSDMGTTTRIYWTLKSLGLAEIAILNGGFSAWRRAGLPASTAPASVRRSDWAPRWQDTWQISTQAIEQRIGDPQLRLVDARPGVFFDGSRSYLARPGTIAGAASLSFERWFEGGSLKQPEALRQTLQASPLPPAAETVSFCNTGHWASINWFVLSELLGIPDTRLYAESMVEWSQADRPMDNQPSRLGHYWQMTVDWLSAV